MKRDMNLIRDILLALEASTRTLIVERTKDGTTGGSGWPVLDLPGRTDAEISYHVRLLHEAGLIHAQNVTTHDTPVGQEDWRATDLTPKGHDFLDAARDESVWKAALAKVGGATAGVALSAVLELLLATVKEKLGLPR